MTVKLYDENSHLFSFEARVLSCEKNEKGYAVTLDATAFFPEGGGQPSDIGSLENIEVFDVQIEGEDIVHYTAVPLETGSIVKGAVNSKRRLDFMRQHSAEHIVSGVAHSLYGCENVGFHLSEETVTLDFDKYLSGEQIARLEELANEVVLKNVRVTAFYPTEEQLKNIEYRSKKEICGAVRIVEIECVDKCACCAPHVDFTGEIGPIKLLKAERLRSGVRIELKSGKRATDDYSEKHANIAAIGELLCVKHNEAAMAVQKLLEATENLEFLNKGLSQRLCNTVIASTDNAAVFLEDFTVKELQIIADGLHNKTQKTHFVFSKTEEKINFAFCGEERELSEKFADFKQSFSLRGGGRNGLVQGTVEAKISQLQEYFKD